jgi:hypothetical protein
MTRVALMLNREAAARDDALSVEQPPSMGKSSSNTAGWSELMNRSRHGGQASPRAHGRIRLTRGCQSTIAVAISR